MRKRKICVVTGTRSEYGLLRPLMERVRASPKLELQTVVTCMHLMPEFGETIREIEADGFKIDAQIPVRSDGDSKAAMTASIGYGIVDMVAAFERLNPDIVLVLGDRFEVMSAAIAAVYSGRVLAHLSGGHKTRAGYDEYTRHAITKMAHLHFPCTKKNAERIIRMGEDRKRVFAVGSTSLDTILGKKLPSEKDIRERYHLPKDKPLFLIVQHPLSTSPDDAKREMRTTLDAVSKFDCLIVGVYPNADPGGRRMIGVIQEYERNHPGMMQWHKSLPFDDYLAVMRIADVMIGNSSSGIIESSSFHLPTINIGPRQGGRERACNVIDSTNDSRDIATAIRRALSQSFRNKAAKCINPYGDGHASERIVKVLESIKIDKNLLEKQITY